MELESWLIKMMKIEIREFFLSKDSLDALKENNLASHSLFLLLVLINHCTTGNNSPNMYRESLITFGNERNENGKIYFK